MMQTPSRQRFASTFRTLSKFSFWLQLALGTVSALAIFLAISSRNLSAGTDNPAIGIGIFLCLAGICVLIFRLYWAFQYRRTAKLLQTADRAVRPSRQEVLEKLRFGLLVSGIGLAIAFFASEISAIGVLAKSLAEPQGVAIYNRENVVRSLDLFVLSGGIHLIGAHLVGGVTSLGLLEWLEQ